MTDEQINEMLDKLVARITNPALSLKRKILYARNEILCMMLVADKWQLPVIDVFRIVQEREDRDDVPMHEPEHFGGDEDRIFWDFINEMEPFDLKEWGME